MAGNVINLRRERKRRARKDASDKAAENRARFGRTSVEKLIDRRDEERRTIDLDGHKLGSGDPGADGDKSSSS